VCRPTAQLSHEQSLGGPSWVLDGVVDEPLDGLAVPAP
jgi:hypothetical protein